jgi:hypothetical protein
MAVARASSEVNGCVNSLFDRERRLPFVALQIQENKIDNLLLVVLIHPSLSKTDKSFVSGAVFCMSFSNE